VIIENTAHRPARTRLASCAPGRPRRGSLARPGRAPASGIAVSRTAVAAGFAQPDRFDQVADFYAHHADDLRRIVARHVAASHATIEDACQTAWASLLRGEDVALSRRGVGWLATVAIREGWRLGSIKCERPQPRCATISPAVATGSSPRDRRGRRGARPRARRARERVSLLQALRPRERRELFLQGLGYRYEEIASLTGSSDTAINRRIAEGRAQLRQLEGERTQR
jgi:DNA-directed RNA polymerase specialized sigma24 family protein